MHLHRSLSAVLLCLIIWSELAAQSLNAHIDRGQLHVSAPRMHFLTGEALARLRDGATVKFEFQLTARADRNGRVLARSLEGFAISFDLWEEKFAITRLGSSPKSISHLSTAAAEAWCIDNTTLPLAVFSETQPFWIRLDYRVDESSGGIDTSDNSGFTLSGLIDIFSRRTRGEQLHGFEEIGPLTLDRLKK
jgi:hypothetical protein